MTIVCISMNHTCTHARTHKEPPSNHTYNHTYIKLYHHSYIHTFIHMASIKALQTTMKPTTIITPWLSMVERSYTYRCFWIQHGFCPFYGFRCTGSDSLCSSVVKSSCHACLISRCWSEGEQGLIV